MEAYTGFASVYDLFMDNIEYEAWSSHLIRRLRDDGIQDGIVCELGCGTGTMTELLASAGYDMIGIDFSEEMLQAAQEKKLSSGHDILYLLQDIREFELYGTVRAVISVCDSLNYMLEAEELLAVFRLVNNYLDPGGIFLFDMSTEQKYASIGSDTIAEVRDEGSFIWENEYDPESRCNAYQLTLFVPEGDLYCRIDEYHEQRAWQIPEIRRLIEEAGMEWVGVWDAYTDDGPKPDSQRLLFAARERGKSDGTIR